MFAMRGLALYREQLSLLGSIEKEQGHLVAYKINDGKLLAFGNEVII
jgi:hypothetical protein